MKTFYYVTVTHKGHRLFIEKTRGHNFSGLVKPDESCLYTNKSAADNLKTRMLQSSSFENIRLGEVTVG